MSILIILLYNVKNTFKKIKQQHGFSHKQALIMRHGTFFTIIL